MKKERSAAILTFKAPGRMTPKGRRAIAKWLRMHATHLIDDGKNYTKNRFTARYLYR